MKRWSLPFVVAPVFLLLGAASGPDACDGLDGGGGDAGGSTSPASTGPYGSVCCGGTGSCTDGLQCCVQEGGSCSGDYDCCGGLCTGGDAGDLGTGGGTCAASGNAGCIAALGSRCPSMATCACATDDDCCQEGTGAVCGASSVTSEGKRCCLSTGIPCGGNGDCCSGSCDETQLACD